jgi:anaerobic selenocysteine-containing dehydrogenase
MNNVAGNLTTHKINLTNLLVEPQEPTRAIFWHGNPCARLPDGNNTKSGLKNIPLTVHFSSYPNETYHYSNVSLPISSWLEYAGLLASNNSRALQWHHAVIKAPGECLSPLQIWSMLVSQFNLTDYFPWKTDDGVVDAQAACNFFLHNNPLTRTATVEAMDPEKNPSGGLLWPCVEEEDLEFENTRFTKGTIRGKNILFQRDRSFPTVAKRFPTLDGKISLSIIPQSYDIDTTKKDDSSDHFPFVLTAGVLVDYIEAYGFFLSDRAKFTKTGILHVHPQVGTALKVKNGDMVNVENERGRITAPVWLNPDLNPKVVWFPDGIDPYQPRINNESLFNLFELTDPNDYTMVAIFKINWDRAKAEEQISNVLKKHQNNY